MNEAADPILPATMPLRHPWYHWRRLGFNFLTISILAHFFLGVGATYLVVQNIQAKRKQTFTTPPTIATAPMHALEHQVKMQKQRQTMSAPAPLKRITTTSNVKIALPALPAMPKLDSSITPLAMAGMGGSGLGLGMGASGGGGGGGDGGGGGGMSLFGMRSGGMGLVGTFYDLKQTTTRQPTNMTPAEYGKIISEFIKDGFNLGVLGHYYKSDRPLYATQIWIPKIPAELGPAAFGLERIVEPKMWCVHYKGRVVAPAAFTFHFVGAGDDVLCVKFNGKLVLERCYSINTGWKSQADYHYAFSNIPGGFAEGDAIAVEAGQICAMEVIIGEQPGGNSFATLLQQVDGVQYDKDSGGNPILPVFRLSNARPASGSPSRPYPPHRDDGPVWGSEPPLSGEPSSFFNH